MDTISWLTPHGRHERRRLRNRFILTAAVAFAFGVNFAVWACALLTR